MFYVRVLIILFIFLSGFFMDTQSGVAETIKSYYLDGKLQSEVVMNNVDLPHGLAPELASDEILRFEKRYEAGWLWLQGISP